MKIMLFILLFFSTVISLSRAVAQVNGATRPQKGQDKNCISKVGPEVCTECEKLDVVAFESNKHLKGLDKITECFFPTDPPFAYIRKNKIGLKEVSLTSGARYTFFPDQHTSPEPSRAFQSQLKKLKSEGVSVLFMEMLNDGSTIDPKKPFPSDETIRSMLSEK
ncbi:MAG: hypothetical protein A2381_07330 [Bdellovibrionales bacterium RIFOXYB1_FULL_37_110]|nr:MAG: hypothetical protein A2181_04095 [Bdellovibrionales bacterium RIFOXYA1_FULL_38_20]OFZ52422.1 MAG: hypothetical protein A2417_00050 [Bdellovibrionales bacterium RIFOXYC1_FULL_37_79]OFZ59624.1 MAG: hypothetical protein A2381_07330 [Bdellovibrionales bacterium RIFOXYB1_FULL_37_110]OFZ62551.1 MAG: hypothetical protein A2577_11650 [Bdellovibrionales bacterium RIFOXYD1_FULL_36_51]